MKKVTLLFLFLLYCFTSFSQIDTTRYNTGEIQYIYQRYHFRKEFYKNGILKEFRINDTFFRKGKRREYDENGKLSAKGKFNFFYVKQCRWIYYTNGKTDSVVHYKYGINEQPRSRAARYRITNKQY